MIVYLNAEYIPRAQALVSVDDRGFLFGDGIYEVITVYQGKPFKTDAHLKRLQDGLRALRIKGVDPAIFRQAGHRLLMENNLTQSDATWYIQVTRGAAPRLQEFPPEDVTPTTYMSATRLPPGYRSSEKTLAAILVPDLRWTRCDVKSISLVANVLARQRAVEAGANEAILVRDGVAIEGSFSSLFAVFDGMVITHPNTNYLLPGVTRDVVLDLCRKHNIPCREDPILETEIHQADELFLTSTTMEIVPLVQLDNQPIAGGKAGSVTMRLKQLFRDMIEEFLECNDRTDVSRNV
jgi:D-alanine transaminase